MKVLTVVGTRPEIIRLSGDSQAGQRHAACPGPHRPELRSRAEPDLLRRAGDPDAGLRSCRRPERLPAETIGLVIAGWTRCWPRMRPDAVLILGDTNSCLAAIAAKRRKIPVFHMEAGNRCFDQRVPEEINRRIIDHISDINLPYSASRGSTCCGRACHPIG